MIIMHKSFDPGTGNADPWRRLAAKIVERAVYDTLQGAPRHKISGASWLTSDDVRHWADDWGLQLPWEKIKQVARLEVKQLVSSSQQHYRHQ